MSKIIASVSLKAHMNGLASSKFAPMPLNNKSGGRSERPRLMPTRSFCSPTSTIRTSISSKSDRWSAMEMPAQASVAAVSIKHISSGGRYCSGVAIAAEFGGRGDFCSGSLVEPIAPMQPPASVPLFRTGEERVPIRCSGEAGDERCLWIGWRVQEALQVAAVGQHKGRVVAVNLRCLIDALPWRDMFGYPGHDIDVR